MRKQPLRRRLMPPMFVFALDRADELVIDAGANRSEGNRPRSRVRSARGFACSRRLRWSLGSYTASWTIDGVAVWDRDNREVVRFSDVEYQWATSVDFRPTSDAVLIASPSGLVLRSSRRLLNNSGWKGSRFLLGCRRIVGCREQLIGTLS